MKHFTKIAYLFIDIWTKSNFHFYGLILSILLYLLKYVPSLYKAGWWNFCLREKFTYHSYNKIFLIFNCVIQLTHHPTQS